MKLEVTLKAKICLWYKALLKLVCILVRARLVKAGTASKIISKLSGKGCKYKVGNGKWNRLNRNSDCKIARA